MLSQVARSTRWVRLGCPSASLVPSLVRSNATTPSPSQSWTDTLKNALPSFGSSSPSQTPLKHAIPDPLRLVKKELNLLRGNVSHLLGSGHPSLDTVAKYYFTAEGKHLRPTIVLLMSQATNGLGSNWPEARTKHDADMNKIVAQRSDVINDFNPGMPEDTSAFRTIFTPGPSLEQITTPRQTPPPLAPRPIHTPLLTSTPTLLPSQRRLAEIVEMIHVASLLHDDVIDTSPLRRSLPSSPALFGNKLSILSGDFLLGRASAGLSRLGSVEVVELMSTAIANLVEGEVMQLKATTEPERRPTQEGFDYYMQKTYMKTASLMAKSARSAVVLGGCEDEGLKDVAYAYGRNLGIAFQVSRSRGLTHDFVSDH